MGINIHLRELTFILFQQERGSAIWKFHGKDDELDLPLISEPLLHILHPQLILWKNLVSVMMENWN